MNSPEFLLSLIDSNGGSIQGRTLVQKKAFFVSVLSGINPNLGFDAHYYGPFSSIVESTLTTLKNLGFLQEASTGFGVVSGGFEMKRYDYSLTDDGQALVRRLRDSAEYAAIQDAARRIEAAGDPNYVELSIAAKAFFLLKRKGRRMSVRELKEEGEKFNWSISPESIKKAVSFLEQIGLATAR